MSIKTALFSIPALCLLLASCRPGEIELRIKPAAKNHYQMIFSSGGKVSMKMMDEEIGSNINTQISSTLDVDTLPGDKFSFRLTYEDFNVKQDIAGKEIDLKNLAADTGNQVKEGMNLIKGISFETVVNASGKTEAVTGTDSILHKMDNSLKALPDNIRQQLLAAITPLVKNDMAKGLLEQCFYVLPSKKVNIGDSWRNEIEMHSMFSMIIKSTYTLEQIKDSMAYIKVHAVIKPGSPDVVMPVSALAMAAPKGSNPKPENDGMDLFGMKMKAAFEGTGDGMVWVNMRTGMVQKSKLNQDLTGKISISLFDLPMTMKMVTGYEVKPL